MLPSTPEEHRFLLDLEKLGIEKVRANLQAGSYGPRFDKFARKWLTAQEEMQSTQRSARTLTISRWQLILAILALIAAILIGLLTMDNFSQWTKEEIDVRFE